MNSAFSRYLREEDGAAASEYAVLVAIVIAAVALGVSYFNIDGIYNIVSQTVSNCVTNASTAAQSGTC